MFFEIIDFVSMAVANENYRYITYVLKVAEHSEK